MLPTEGLVVYMLLTNFLPVSFSVPTLTVEALVSGGPCGADGAM